MVEGHCGYVFSTLVGAAGGILLCLEKDVFFALEYVSEQRVVAVKGDWADSLGPDRPVCVYAPTNRNKRKVFLTP